MNDVRIGVDRKTRAITIAGVAVLHLALVAALIAAFGVEAVVETVRSVAAFNVPAPSPPPSPTPEPAPRADRAQGAAAPPAPKATPRPRPSPRIVVSTLR